MRYFNVGGPVVLFVLGATLYFAVTASVGGISISTVGMILMIGAALWLSFGMLRSRTPNTVCTEERHIER